MRPTSPQATGSIHGSESVAHPNALKARSEIASLFRELRQVLNRTRVDIANQLGTSPSTIKALETGNYDLLPPWFETRRVVLAYTNLVGVDPNPALHVLHNAIAAADQTVGHMTQGSAVQQPPPPKPAFEPPNGSGQGLKLAKGQSLPTASGNATARDDAGRATTAIAAVLSERVSARGETIASSQPRHNLKSHLMSARNIMSRVPKSAVIAVLGALLLTYALSLPSVTHVAEATLPAPMANLVKSVRDAVFGPTIVERDGLRWVEVADPRSRRTDKLPMPEQKD